MKKAERDYMLRNGMTEEQIKDFERYFDADIKRLQRNNAVIKEKNISFICLDKHSSSEDEVSINDIEDNTVNENAWIDVININRLRFILSQMPEKDRRILYVSFSGIRNHDQVLAEEYGVTRSAIKYRRETLLKKLRKEFNVKI